MDVTFIFYFLVLLFKQLGGNSIMLLKQLSAIKFTIIQAYIFFKKSQLQAVNIGLIRVILL